VLVVDDDPWSQQVIASQLTRAGFRVDSAGDGWEALIMAGHGQPDLIVIEVHLPTTDAWSLAGEVRGHARLANVPFIFMAGDSPGLRPGKGFRPGLDQLLLKPFTIVDLRAAVDMALGDRAKAPAGASPTRLMVEVPSSASMISRLSAQAPPPPSESWEMEGLEPALRGSLVRFGLSSLLMVIELERMSGVVTLQCPSGVGRAAIRNGRVIRARIDGDPGIHGAQAIHDMLKWSNGTFEFDAGSVDGEDEIDRSTSFLVMEAARLADELAHGKQKS
jgi:DNA-binding response OmpR family regulator